MTDWSDNALGRLKQQRENQRLRDAKFLEKQRIKKAHGGPLWQEVKKIVTNEITAFNAKSDSNEKLILEVTPANELRVVANIDGKVQRLQATFDEEIGKLSWECGGKAGHWELVTTDDGGAQFQFSMMPEHPGAIARRMLDALLF